MSAMSASPLSALSLDEGKIEKGKKKSFKINFTKSVIEIEIVTNPLERCSFVCPMSFVTLIVTKSFCDCPSFELFSERELSSLGRGSSSGFGFCVGLGPEIRKLLITEIQAIISYSCFFLLLNINLHNIHINE